MSSARPRILYLTPYWPHRASCASELRALHIARALAQMGTVEMVVVDAEGGESEWRALPQPEFRVHYGVPVRMWPGKNVAQKLNWAINPRSAFPHGCGVDDEALQRVSRTAEDFELVWFCKLRTPNMFSRPSWPRSVADIDDVPSTFEQSVLEHTQGMRARVLARMRYWSWKRRDQRVGERFSVLGVCSEPDRHHLQSLGVRAPVHVLPNGFERPAVVPVRRPSTPPRIGFIGIFDYAPNLGGVEWFARECWPLIKKELPDARLRLVGRQSNGPLKPAGPDIDGLGFLPEVTEEMTTWSAMVVPIQTGAGTRGKIAHAFSAKCPVVSTPLGAHGYEAHSGDEMLLADSPVDFARACVRLVRNQAEADAIAERAWQKFLQSWTWEAIRPRVWAAAEDALRLNPNR